MSYKEPIWLIKERWLFVPKFGSDNHGYYRPVFGLGNRGYYWPIILGSDNRGYSGPKFGSHTMVILRQNLAH